MTGGNEEGTNERAGTVTGEGNSSHRNQAALCQRQNGRNSIGRGSSTREDQFPRHNDALLSNGASEKRASSKSWDSNTRANARETYSKQVFIANTIASPGQESFL